MTKKSKRMFDEQTMAEILIEEFVEKNYNDDFGRFAAENNKVEIVNGDTRYEYTNLKYNAADDTLLFDWDSFNEKENAVIVSAIKKALTTMGERMTDVVPIEPTDDWKKHMWGVHIWNKDFSGDYTFILRVSWDGDSEAQYGFDNTDDDTIGLVANEFRKKIIELMCDADYVKLFKECGKKGF